MTKKQTKTASITLRSKDEILTLLAVHTETGARTSVTTKKPNEKPTRGMTEAHKTFDAAKARLEALAKDAQRQGWVRGTFASTTRPDAFSTMPKPSEGK